MHDETPEKRVIPPEQTDESPERAAAIPGS